MPTASIILDLAVVLIVIGTVIFSAVKGLAGMLLHLAAMVAAAVLAFSLASPVADFTFRVGVEPAVTEKVEETLREGGGRSLEEQVNGVFDSLPGFVVNILESAGVSKESMQQSFRENMGADAHDSAQRITESAFRPAVTPLLYVLCLLVLFLVFFAVLSVAASMLEKLFHLPVIGTVNHVLGGVLGLVKAAVVLLVLSLCVAFSISVTHNESKALNREAVESTYLYRTIEEYNPLIGFIE